jgi:ADP-heptose:LPS heptosyltransferase
MNGRLWNRLLGPVHPLSPGDAGARLARAERVLLVKPHHKLGDLLVATPVIRNLRRALPRAHLAFVAGPYNAPAVLDSPDLDEVIVARLKGPAALLHGSRLVRGLRERRFDAALVLSSISHSASAVALARRARPGFVAGLDDAPYGSDLARRGYDCVIAPPEDQKIHIVDYNLALLEGLGIPVTGREHVLGVTGEQRAAGRERLRGAGVDPDRPLLGIQPGGNPRHPERLWPGSHYAVLAQKARGEAGHQVVLLGQGADAAAVEAIQRMGREPFPVLLDLPFPVYKGVLAGLHAFVTHDGGPVHVAAGLGVRSFFIFLHTPPWRWAPYGAHVSVWEDFTRSPDPSEAWARLEPILAAHALPPGRPA